MCVVVWAGWGTWDHGVEAWAVFSVPWGRADGMNGRLGSLVGPLGVGLAALSCCWEQKVVAEVVQPLVQPIQPPGPSVGPRSLTAQRLGFVPQPRASSAALVLGWHRVRVRVGAWWPWPP